MLRTLSCARSKNLVFIFCGWWESWELNYTRLFLNFMLNFPFYSHVVSFLEFEKFSKAGWAAPLIASWTSGCLVLEV